MVDIHFCPGKMHYKFPAVDRIGCDILFWHSPGLAYNYYTFPAVKKFEF